jgi:hypothetical protein
MALAGCGGAARVHHPDVLLRHYVEALESGRIDAAYELLSAGQRRRVSRQAFHAAADGAPGEVEAQARELRRQLSEPVSVSAEVPLENGEAATLTLQGGRWRIAAGAAGAVSLSSPLHAVRALRRALQRRSYAAVVRVLSRDARSQLEDEVARIVDALDDEGSLAVEVTGNRARVVYDETHFIELSREDGEWVVVDMD